MKKTTLFISSLVLSSILVFGQHSRKVQVTSKVDNTTERYEKMPKTPDGFIRCITPDQKEPEAQFENWLSQKIKEVQLNPSLLKASRNIPVVVHVLHNGDAVGSGENISVAQINSQITALNQDYSATNADFANVPAAFNSAKGNMDIQFCLAQTDPNGQPTTGIHRVNMGASVSSVSDTDIETNYGLNNMWDPTKYLNIFVANFTGGQLLGKAVFPLSSGLPGLGGSYTGYDGVMIWYRAFGTTGSLQAPFNKGRTATHEIGHWLGLRHIGGDQLNGCGTDYCADTPTQKGGIESNGTGNGYGQNYGCPTHPLVRAGECSGTTAEMFMNYMDYTDDPCMYMFTNNQKARMDAVLLNSPRRKELLTSNVCSAAAITADFTGNPLVINEGQTVTFTSTSSSPATLNSWNWTFTGGVPGSFNGQTPPAITYNTAGTYAVSLTVGDNASGNDTETKTAYITVNTAGTSLCDTVSNFQPNFTPSLNGSAGWGWVSGHNDYGDIGKADKYSTPTAGYKITGAQMMFAKAYSGSGTSTVTVKVWNGASGTPGAVLGSVTVPISSLSVYPNLTNFTFPSPITVTNNYFLGIQFTDGSPQDSLALVHSADSVDLIAGQGTAWELWSDNSWHSFDETPDSWGMDVALAIYPILCNNITGIENKVDLSDKLLVFPNPSSGIVEVLLPKNNGTVKVYNMIGEEVSSNLFTSNYAKVDLSNQPNGIYFVKVSSNGEVTTKKVILSK